MSAFGVDAPAEARALHVVRAAAVVTAAGAVSSPPLAGVGSVLMLMAYAFVPGAWLRLQRVLAQPLGLGWLALTAALCVAAIVGSVAGSPAAAGKALLDWRHFLLLPVALAVFDTALSRRRFALALVAIALIGAVAALVATLVGYSRNDMFPGIVLRNPVTQALTFSIGALLAGLLAVTQRASPRWARAVLAVAALLLVAQLVFMQTGRSGFVALLVAAAVTPLFLLRGRALAVAIVVVPLIGTAAVSASGNLQQRFGTAISEMRNAANLPEYTSMGIRMIIWQTSAELIEDRPVLGYGLGGFPSAYEQRIQQKHRDGWKALPTADPHNQYLFLWAEAGLLGLAGFAAFLLGALRQPGERVLRAGALGLLAAWCVNSLFSSHFQTFNEGHLIVLLLGAFLASAPPEATSAAQTG